MEIWGEGVGGIGRRERRDEREGKRMEKEEQEVTGDGRRVEEGRGKNGTTEGEEEEHATKCS